MTEARRRLRRFALWLVALALGFAAAAAVAAVVARLTERDDASQELATVFWAVVAWAAAGLVAIWRFARPRPNAHRWATVGIPVLGVVTLVLTQTVGAAAMLGYPLIWVGAFWAAILPAPEAPETGGERARRT